MSTEDISPPLAKKGRFDSNCEINKLADTDLALIFKRLPPYDRLVVSEVCKRWHAIASISWLDVTELDLSPIPVDNITAIVKRCLNLRVVSAVRKSLRPSELRLLSRLSLRSVKLYDCTVETCGTDAHPSIHFCGIPAGAAWDELVLHDFVVRPRVPAASSGVVAQHAQLRRLQISRPGDSHRLSDPRAFSRALVQLRSLECLLLHEIAMCDVFEPPNILRNNGDTLRNLRELYLASHRRGSLWQGLMNLPNLQTLFLHHCYCPVEGGFDQLVTKHPSLRIVAFTGVFSYDKEFPMRVRYANGYGSFPLPVLHVFVAKWASKSIRFPKFPSDAAKVYPISEPLPKFLEREDIAAIFEGVWIAEKIKDAAKNGAVLSEEFHHAVATGLRSIDT